MINISYLKKIYNLCGQSKLKIFTIFFYYLISSFFDVIGIALVGSFVTIVIKPDVLDSNTYLQTLDIFNIIPSELPYILGIFIIILFLVKTFLIIFVYKQIINFSFNIQSSLREKLMRSYLNLDYEEYTSVQTSNYIQMSGNMVKTYGSVLNAFLQSTGDFIIFFSISIFLIFINVKIYLVLMFSLIIFFIIYKKLFLDKLKLIGELLNKNYSDLYRNIREFFQGFKEIQILNISKLFSNNVRMSAKNIANYDKKNAFITIMPKYLLEVFFVIFIITIFLFAITKQVDETIIISTSSFFIASTIRILPSVLQFIRLKSTFNLGINSINKLTEELQRLNDFKLENSKNNFSKTNFENMKLSNVSFKYKNSKNYTLKNINLIIAKNKLYGIKGSSGSGKTTLIDLMMGLINPTEGKILINNNIDLNQKQFEIAYISQKTFLLNDTILKNITLSENIDEISIKDFESALKLANIKEFVEKTPNKYLSNVGEDGLKISGGQRQRIALARSFFFNKDIIFLDEPTSALDLKNADEIMHHLNNLKDKKTIIVTSHSKNVLEKCDEVFNLQNGTLIKE